MIPGVCQSVCHAASLCKRSWTDGGPVWDGDCWVPKKHLIRRESGVSLRIRYGLTKVLWLLAFRHFSFIRASDEAGDVVCDIWWRVLQVFHGNSNTYIAEVREVSPPIIARRIRIVPQSSYPRTICMRVELYGCQWRGSRVHISLSLASKINLFITHTTKHFQLNNLIRSLSANSHTVILIIIGLGRIQEFWKGGGR